MTCCVIIQRLSRNAINSGATDNSVAAETIDQSTPDSGAPKIPRPTVSGRVSTELVMTGLLEELLYLILTETEVFILTKFLMY